MLEKYLSLVSKKAKKAIILQIVVSKIPHTGDKESLDRCG